MYYVGKRNEMVSKIVEKFDIPFEQLKRLNPWVEQEGGIYEGRVFTFPLKYIVLPGDTYENIREKASISVREFSGFNPDIDGHSVLYPGQTVLLPPASYRMMQMRQNAEEQLVTQLKSKEKYEEISEPIFTTDAGFITITFDDGPSTHTERLLEILAEKDVRAIFFMLGENVTRYRDAARKVADAGHVVGNHSWSHPFFTKISPAQQAEELKRTSDLIADVTGIGPRFFRPPYGAFNETTTSLVLKDNMKVVMWSADPRDYSYNTGGSVFNASEPLLSSRKILLLHDLKEATVVALPRIIDAIREKKLSITEEFEK